MEQHKWTKYLCVLAFVIFAGILSRTEALQCYSCDTKYEQKQGEMENKTMAACKDSDWDKEHVPLVNCTVPTDRGNSSEGFRPKDPEDRTLACLKTKTVHKTALFTGKTFFSRGCAYTNTPNVCNDYDGSFECYCDSDECNSAGLIKGSLLGLMLSLGSLLLLQ